MSFSPQATAQTGASAQTDLRMLKGDATRARLLERAIELFAEHGFAGVSTRTLALAAASNVALITFHFGSKQGLYEAAILETVERLKHVLDPTIDKLEGSNLSETKPQELLRSVVASIFLQVLPHGPTPGLFQLLFRELHADTQLARRSLDKLITPLILSIEKVIQAINPSQSQQRSRLTSVLLVDTMALVFRDHQIMLRYMNQNSFTPDDAEFLADLLCRRIPLNSSEFME